MIFVYLYFNKKDIVLDLRLPQFSFDRKSIGEIIVVAVPLYIELGYNSFFRLSYQLLTSSLRSAGNHIGICHIA